MKHIKVESIEHLDSLIAVGDNEFFIVLNDGMRSYKTIGPTSVPNKRYYIYNNIDDTDQYLTKEELWTESNIGEALNKGALYVEFNEN